MGDNSTIEWTDATWNPVRGCAIVSKGCTNCYAMRQAIRHTHKKGDDGKMKPGPYQGLVKMSKGGPVWTGAIRTVPELLDQPLRWRRPRRIFVNSMSDLFHEDVSATFIGTVLGIAAACPQHTFQVLTKRPRRMRTIFDMGMFNEAYENSQDMYRDRIVRWPPPNVWLGVSVEDQAAADERIPLLLQAPAAVRWISAEPLLGPVDLWRAGMKLDGKLNAQTGERAFLHWVVAGGESGPGARPMHPDWARALRDQCEAAGVPFFFKQWGCWAPCVDFPRHSAGDELKQAVPGRMGPPNGAEKDFEWMVHLAKKIAGRQLDGRTHEEYPA